MMSVFSKDDTIEQDVRYTGASKIQYTHETSSEKSRKRITELRERSGHVAIHDKLVSFLYELMRDHVPPGIIEAITNASEEIDVLYTNGWLAKYAEDVAKRLK
jgi:hypothetical protein